MKVAVVYNPLDNKVREDTYSFIYRGMLDAVIEKFRPHLITENCNAQDIDADAILFWDVNSCHHIKIEGIEKNPAIKIEYMSDPFQKEVTGIYQRYKMFVHKLNAEQRIRRALERGVSHIICPVKSGYFRYFAPILGNNLAEEMLWFFPPSPWFDPGNGKLTERKQTVLANGSTGDAQGAYDLRTWAFKRPGVTLVKHFISDPSTPMGSKYGEFLKEWAGALALCDLYPVVKYYEIPLAGCVTFMQYHEECEGLGFKDHESCVYVNRENFDTRVKDFLADVPSYQKISDAGKNLMKENYTARHFANFLEKSIGGPDVHQSDHRWRKE